ncbi:hypothetical protein Aple_097290 [Acrocarpospora pleiomorpha]|uniref:HTH cro/C1-type domain-containing protein n=1 Tax=Acrocarpospora pleiomorpha TaxID=90975 RepID=A0A5M3Y0R3_9ACTN|nr:helix-turn-helix transcriptional regulator [Acrocarpospora pleiomorpha]GES26830.1 hypothetical protein Aple_097290 [Acrocarpospora pleiomorpha]
MDDSSESPLRALGVELRRILATKGWTTQAFATRAGLSRTIVSQALNGSKVPTIRTVTRLAQALRTDVEALLALRDQAEREAARPKTAPEAGQFILDVGSVEDPNMWIPAGEVRFTVSNGGTQSLKLTSLILRVINRVSLMETLGLVTAAPVDEYFLHARITPDTTSVELLDRHHVLAAGETDGFLLKIDGPEGYVLELDLLACWHELGAGERRTAASTSFAINFPAQSAAGLLSVIRRMREAAGED